ncbi:hypothetical protein V1514DRAFT_327400 [Lipomyces japonicus]|uniref:uncharacterized protein n=1 Tax=Lipomyces japonicus TaxID=56871 RepID=UPI0034CDCF89
MPDCPVIIALDWDAFYCSVEEHHDPSLKNVPFAVRQKSIICTCNYIAREKGVKKLQRLVEAIETCPEMRIVNGEDLSRYRDASKELWQFVKLIIWQGKVERLGFDELFLDVTIMIDFNLELIRHEGLLNDLDALFKCCRQSNSFWFRLDKNDKTKGFACSLTTIPGHFGTDAGMPKHISENEIRLILGFHLCEYVRRQIFDVKGYTSSGGVSTNKLLSKMAGAQNKPNQQTLLFPQYAQDFLDDKDIARIPGMGHSYKKLLLHAMYGQKQKKLDSDDFKVISVRSNITKGRFIQVFKHNNGHRLWDLIHGIDNSCVRPTAEIPTQVSIEDTFMSLSSLDELKPVLHRLSESLLARMRIDLKSNGLWIGYPSRIRLTLRHRASDYGARISKSEVIPSTVFKDERDVREVASVLVERVVMPLFKKLVHDARSFDIVLVNIAAVNIESSPVQAKDITLFLDRQKRPNANKILNQQVKKSRVDEGVSESSSDEQNADWIDEADEDNQYDYDDCGHQLCGLCGTRMLTFAVDAHMRFHEANNE